MKPEYYNQAKPKPDKEEILVERKCNLCYKKIKVHRFERFCTACKQKVKEMCRGSIGM